MSHPTLGLPPRDLNAGQPAAAARIRAAASSLGARALAVAIDRDPTLRERYDETGLRARLRDAELLAERLALCIAAGSPAPLREYAEWTAIPYRRMHVPLDDLINLCEGLRAAIPGLLAPGELEEAGRALDEGIATFKWNRRLAGDARKRNAFLQLLYKGG